MFYQFISVPKGSMYLHSRYLGFKVPGEPFKGLSIYYIGTWSLWGTYTRDCVPTELGPDRGLTTSVARALNVDQRFERTSISHKLP